MTRRKQNISRWYLLGLASILMAGCLVVSVGTTLARYRVDNEKQIDFINRTPVAIALGVMEDDIFLPDGTIKWQEQNLTTGEGEEAITKKVYTLNFAVSNYLEETEFDKEDIQVHVRLIGTLDAWSESAEGTVVLTDGVLLEDGTQRELVATVTGIPENTALYHSFGAGWVFQFLDEYDRELVWTLEGGQLSCQELNITMDASLFSGTSLLQLQISGSRPE